MNKLANFGYNHYENDFCYSSFVQKGYMLVVFWRQIWHMEKERKFKNEYGKTKIAKRRRPLARHATQGVGHTDGFRNAALHVDRQYSPEPCG
jgi:hypothetical protein